VDRKGKERKKYETYMTPFERLLSLKCPENTPVPFKNYPHTIYL